MSSVLLTLGCLFLLSYPSLAYKHVILMHGLFGHSGALRYLIGFINKYHPGTTVTAIDAYDYVLSLRPMWDQTYKVADMMASLMKEHPEGVHLICYSQGGLLCRAVIQILRDHNVQNFISLSAPQGGQFGDTKFLKYLFPSYIKEEIYKFFYTEDGQKISIGNYWNDPHHQQLYYEKSEFLAVINNQSLNNHSLSSEFRANFLRLKNLILIGGPDDEVISPWQSSQFAAYDSNETVVDMRRQSWYTNDWFGLRTLDRRGAITEYTVSGTRHLAWTRNETVFKNCIEKWLD